MSEVEKRELDAWIAEHVMGYRRTYNPDDHTADAVTLFWHRPAGDTRESVLIGSAWQHKNYGPKEMFSHSWTHYSPTTDPAAAMEVLKKCAEHADMPIEIDRKRDKKTGHWRVETGTMAQAFLAIAPPDCNTLELAICLFAKKLFTK